MQRAAASLPVTVYRPASVVGDSRTGEIDRFDGPYYLGILLVTSPLVAPLPLPGNGVAPLNVVPVDYLVDTVFNFPTLSEAYKVAALDVSNKLRALDRFGLD